VSEGKARIGKNLALFRKRKRLSQLDVSHQLGIDNSTISKYEHGEREPDIETLEKLAHLYGVRISEIIGNDMDDYATNEALRILSTLKSLSPEKRSLALRMIEGMLSQLKEEEK
jgi:transcriptional regulator with XRE-family HTH domain